MKKFLFVLLAVIVVAGGVFGWYYFYGPCGTVKVRDTFKAVKPIASAFSDAVNLASSTPRISLGDRVKDMQDIRSQMEDVEVPACMNDYKKLVVAGMDNSIDGFIAFIGQKDDNTVMSYFNKSDNYLYDATDELDRIQACAPFCTADPYRVIP